MSRRNFIFGIAAMIGAISLLYFGQRKPRTINDKDKVIVEGWVLLESDIN